MKTDAEIKFSIALQPQRPYGLSRDGEPRTATSTFTQLMSSELWNAGIYCDI